VVERTLKTAPRGAVFSSQFTDTSIHSVISMAAAELRSRNSPLDGELQDEMAAMLKEEVDQTLEKRLGAGVAAN